MAEAYHLPLAPGDDYFDYVYLCSLAGSLRGSVDFGAGLAS
jgi:hypothetical protein